MDNTQEYFEYKVQYGTGIQSRIQKVHNAIENGKDATNEFDNLISYLTDEIKDPIKKDLLEISQKYKARTDTIQSTDKFPETSFKWSNKHKQHHILSLIGKEQTNCINEMLSLIMNRLNIMGYLGKKQQRTQI